MVTDITVPRRDFDAEVENMRELLGAALVHG
jgi:hypothetical protein